MAEGIHQGAKLAIIRAEIMPPFGYAMRLVDREEGQFCRAQQIPKARLAGTFGRDVQQVQLPRPERIHRLAPVGIGAGQRGSADAVGAGGTQLVMHQGDQRRNHHAGAIQHGSRQLIGKRLARAGRHYGEGGFAAQYARNNIRLLSAKIGKAKKAAQFVARHIEIEHLGHRGCCDRSQRAPPHPDRAFPRRRGWAIVDSPIYSRERAIRAMKKLAIIASTAVLALAACGDTTDASDDAVADTVEVPADDAMDGVPDPVADNDAMIDNSNEDIDAAMDESEADAEAAGDAAENAVDDAIAAAEAAQGTMEDAAQDAGE